MLSFSPAIPPRGDLDWCWYLRREGASGEALERALHDVGVLHPGGWADWQPSVMTNTGAPVEMLFTGHQSALALRTEIDDPGKDPADRVARACALIARFGGEAPSHALREVISTGQGAGSLRFGAWLGLQQSDQKLTSTLFAEMPEGTGDLIPLLASDVLRPTLDRLADKIQLTMIAHETATGDLSLYFKTACAHSQIVPVLVTPARVSSDLLLNDIGVMVTAGAAFGTPRVQLSFCYTVHRDRPTPTLTLFVASQALFKNDAAIEMMVRGYPGNHMAAYAGLVEQLPTAAPGQTHHGNIGLRATGTECPVLSLGVAAPWDLPAELT